MGDYFYGKIEKLVNDKGFKYPINYVGSLGCIFFSENHVQNYDDAKKSDTKMYAQYFHSLLGKGVYMAPSQFESMFISAAHSKDEIDRTLLNIEVIFDLL